MYVVFCSSCSFWWFSINHLSTQTTFCFHVSFEVLITVRKKLSVESNCYISYLKTVVRSGIRTHAYRSRLRPERSALDHSAILTVGLAQFSSFRCISFGFLLKREMTILHVVWNTKCSLSSIETCTLLFVVRVWLLITELWLKWLQFSVGWWYFLRTWLLP